MHSYHDDYWVIPPTPSISSPFETQTTFGGHNPTLTFANITHVVSDSTFWDARFSGFLAPDDWGDPNSGSLTQPWRYDSATGIASGGSYGFGSFDMTRLALNAKVSHYATDFLNADHDFKFGLQFVHGMSRGFYGYPGGIHYYDYDGEPYYAYVREPYSYGGQFRNTGLFAEDLISVGNRLTLQLGVRFDRNVGTSQDLPTVDVEGSGLNPHFEANETGGTIAGLGKLFTWTVVVPRVGFNLKLTEDGKTLLRGNFGKFTQSMISGELAGVHPGRSPYSLVYFDPATGGFTDVVSVTDPIANLSVDPSTRAPNTDQYSIGFDRELTRDVGIALTYVHQEGRDYTGYEDIVGVYGTDTVTLENGQTLTVFPLLSDADERIYELTNVEEFHTKYDGLSLSLQKRWSNRWQATVSYTLSKAVGLIRSNGFGPSSSQSSVSAYSASRFGRDPNNFTNATGNLLNDRTHMFRVQSSVEIPRIEVMVGTSAQYLTGKPYAGQARVGLPQGGRSIYVEPLGSQRLPSQFLLDLRISKVFRFGEDKRIELLLDILNATQENAEENIVTRNIFSDNFAKANRFIDPRRALIGIKFHF